MSKVIRRLSFMNITIFYIILVTVTVVTGERIEASLLLHIHTDSNRVTLS